MHRAGCEEVNYNPAYKRGWEGKVAACTRPPPAGGVTAAAPGRGSCRLHPMGARGDTWPLGAASRVGPSRPNYAHLAPNRAGLAYPALARDVVLGTRRLPWLVMPVALALPAMVSL